MSPTLTAGVGTFALLSEPDVPHNGRSYLTVEKDAAVGFVYFPLTGKPAGANLATATLRLYTDGAWSITPTVTATAADGFWTGSGLTWNASPGVTGAAETESHASAVDADLFEFDVTTQVAAMLTDGNFGFIIARTDALASQAFYGFGSAYPPQLELTWTTTPAPPTGGSPSGGRAVATNKPPLTFPVGDDCTHIQVQVDAAGSFGTPDFDSGWVAATEGKFYLEGSTYTALGVAGDDIQWHGQWRNLSGDESGFSQPFHYTYRPYMTVTLDYPSDSGGALVTSDDPTVLWSTSGGTQSGYRVTVASAATPLTTAADSTRKAGTAGAWAIPQGAILDSSTQVLTLAVTDAYAREAVEGFPVEKVVTQEFSFQPTVAVNPPDTLTATQIGTSPFVLLQWTRSNRPDSWQIRRDEGIIAGAEETTDLRADDLGIYSWIDYTAAGNLTHHYRVGAKVDGKVSAGGPTSDVITHPEGKWLGDPTRQAAVLLGGLDVPEWDWGEVSATYYPLRGTDAVTVTQSHRGYEGPINGDIMRRDGVAAGEFYNHLQRMRNNPDDTYVVAYPFVAFFATFDHIKTTPKGDLLDEGWNVSLHFNQQGTTIWLHGQTWLESESTLLASYDYEEGTDGATLTTGTNVGALATGGAAGYPKYEADEAIHGAMGFQIPASAGGGWVEYEIPYIFGFSVYLTPRSSSGSGSAVQLRPAFGGGTCAEITLRSGGDLSISDQDGHTVDGSRTHGIYGWVQDKRMRLDGIGIWDNGVLTLWGKVFTSPEAVNAADDIGPVTFPCTSAPGRLRVGNGNSTKHTGYDSVRLYSGNASWPMPLVPDTTEVLQSIPGTVTATGATVRSRILNADTIDLAVSTTLTAGGDPDTPAYYGPSNDGEVDENGFITHDVADQSAGTSYYAKLSTGPGAFIGDVIHWKTRPAIGAAYTYKVALVSCQRNFQNSQTQLGWVDMLAWAPDTVILHGDRDYQGGQYDPSTPWETLMEAYTSQLIGLPAMRQQLARAEVIQMSDDHEFSSNNGDSNDSTDTGMVRATDIFAMQKMFPMYPLMDTRSPATKRSMTGSTMLGKTVRLIFLDAQSLDRSLSTATDDASKTFIGSEADAFVRAELVKPAALNILVCPKALIMDEAHGTPDADQVANYNTWRTDLADFIDTEQTSDGKDIFVYWVGGDRHANAYVGKSNNPVMPGHPALISSGIEQFALDVREGEEDYDEAFGFGDHLLDIPVVQWMEMTIADVPTSGGAGGITVTIQSRESENTWSGSAQTDPTTWTMSDGFTATDTWAYTAMPGDVLNPWAGDATSSTCEIASLTAGCTSVRLRVSPNANMSGSTPYTAAAPDGVGFNKWHVTGLNPFTDYYYAFDDTYTGHFTNSPIGETYHFKTLHAATPGTMVTKIAVGGCGQTAPMNGAVWDDIDAWGPDRVMHLGDFGYPGYLNTSQTTHKQNWADNLQDPGLGRSARQRCMDYVISDHDVNGHHHESNAKNFHDATSQANMDAWVAVVPARVVDVRSPARARYRSYVEGKVRFVLLDTRSWDRTDVRENGVPPNDGASTMLGSTQLTWLQAEIVAAQSASQVIVLFTDPAWNGEITEGNGMVSGSIEASYSDKWPAYSVERDAISLYASSRGVSMFIVHSDSHALQQDDGTHETHGHAVVCAGPFDQNAHAHFQPDYQWTHPEVDEGGGKQPQVQQYVRLTVTQTASTVQIVAEARDCTAITPGAPLTVRTLTKNYP